MLNCFYRTFAHRPSSGSEVMSLKSASSEKKVPSWQFIPYKFRDVKVGSRLKLADQYKTIFVDNSSIEFNEASVLVILFSNSNLMEFREFLEDHKQINVTKTILFYYKHLTALEEYISEVSGTLVLRKSNFEDIDIRAIDRFRLAIKDNSLPEIDLGIILLPSDSEFEDLAMPSTSTTQIKDVMIENPFWVYSNLTVANALLSMNEKKVSSAVVVDEHRRIEGIITASEIVSYIAFGRDNEFDELLVKDLMVSCPIVSKEASVQRTSEAMDKGTRQQYAIVRDDMYMPVGIVSRIDILKWWGKEFAKERESTKSEKK